MTEPLIHEMGAPGRRAVVYPPPARRAEAYLPAEALRADPPDLPEVSELDLVRHYTRLSQRNFSIDTNFYPLGSCTMKYNPKVNEKAAALPGFAALHPLTPAEGAQGALTLIAELESHLAEIAGMDAVTLQPAAGAHGELTGLLMIRACLRDQGRGDRTEVLIPDSAHGTNPATSRMVGLKAVAVKTGPDGTVDVADFESKLGPRTAAMMLTNPNTLGLFEHRVGEIASRLHDAGALLYMDGANLNAIVGRTRPGDFGVDVLHINLHKTFSTPHGGGGPGAGPVAVKKHIEPYLPVPRLEGGNGARRWSYDRPKSVGQVKALYGNFAMLVRAYAYIRCHGPDGLRRNSESAVLNANYLLARLKRTYPPAFDRRCMHECVLSGAKLKKHGVRTLDVAKRLLDYGFHAPTIYFPLVVHEALMIEPTETENRETLDAFAEAMLAIAEEAKASPEKVTQAPHTMPISRVDELTANRKPIVRFLRGAEHG